MKINKIGSFNIHGCEWIINLDNSISDEYCYDYDYHLKIITIVDEYNGVKLNHDSILLNLFRCVVSIICKLEMIIKYNTSNINFLYPFCNLMLNALNSYNVSENNWDGDVNIGGVSYNIIDDSNYCLSKKEKAYGICNPNTKNIYLCTQNEKGLIYNSHHIENTLIHEIIHAVNYELGLYDEKVNSEKVVNPLSNYIYEYKRTLNINLE